MTHPHRGYPFAFRDLRSALRLPSLTGLGVFGEVAFALRSPVARPFLLRWGRAIIFGMIVGDN